MHMTDEYLDMSERMHIHQNVCHVCVCDVPLILTCPVLALLIINFYRGSRAGCVFAYNVVLRCIYAT